MLLFRTDIQFFIWIFIIGRGGYNNAQHAESSFGFLNLATALSGNGQSAKSKLIAIITF